jgi:regulatory protein
LAQHPRRAGRFYVDLDGERLGAVSLEVIAELSLKLGQIVDPAIRARLDAGVRAVHCYDKALDALARRARSRADLGRWLKLREFTEQEIAPALEKLATLGLLDDLEFARGFARSRLQNRGFGPRRVATELARRGVSREVVDQVLAESTAEYETTELETVTALIAKRARSVSHLPPETARRRLHGYLARRGFSPGTIRTALRTRTRDQDHQ